MDTEIIVEGWPQEGKGRDQILLEEIICKYVQNPDNTEDPDDCQEIILSSRDGGGGKYINFKTKSWSINGENFEEELLPLFKDFNKRISKL